MRQNPRVLVLGAGFGGLTFCQELKHGTAEITVIDRQNHHLFQPLLYQVATAGLSAPEIAQPIRSILSDHPRVTVLMGEVLGVDLPARRVELRNGPIEYDYLVLALGGRTSYFGHPEWEEFAPGLKSLEDALHIRRDLLLAFEKAEMETNPLERERLMTIVVVGGGPTGVELAGAFSELARYVLNRDFRHIDPARTRVILIEASPVVLSNMDPELSRRATEKLRQMGVEVRTSTRVKEIRRHEVDLDTGETVRAANIFWAAGVSASPITSGLGVELDRAGRIKVLPDLSLPGHPEVFAIGDLAFVTAVDGRPVPGVSPAAMQMARHVAHILMNELNGTTDGARPSFRYFDKGTMATIGRSAAVAQIGALKFSGLMAWLAWLVVHLLFLVGFRSKIAVLLQWAYSYFAYKRGARLITHLSLAPVEPPPPPAQAESIGSATSS